MKIASQTFNTNLQKWGIWSYHLGLKQPLAVLGSQGRIRKGFIIAQKDPNDHQWRIAEVAPLPSFHQISMQETHDQLTQFLRHQIPPTHPLPQFGIDCISPQRSLDCFESNISGFVPCNWLWNGEALPHNSNNSLTIKLKVGRQPLQNEITFLENLIQKYPNITALRLDSNQQWSLDELQYFWNSCQHLPIEYFEEPLKNPEEMLKCPDIPLALDESVASFENWISLPNIKAIVLKPTLHQNWKELLNIQKKIIISSTFESDLGIWHLAQIALQQNLKMHDPNNIETSPSFSIKHGLNTLSWFDERFVQQPIFQDADGLHIQDPPKINWHLLQFEAGQ